MSNDDKREKKGKGSYNKYCKVTEATIQLALGVYGGGSDGSKFGQLIPVRLVGLFVCDMMDVGLGVHYPNFF